MNDSVRFKLSAFVERGECQVGIVDRTDALMSKKVKIIGDCFQARFTSSDYLSDCLNQAGPEKSEAIQFYKFIQSRVQGQAKSIFQKIWI